MFLLAGYAYRALQRQPYPVLARQQVTGKSAPWHRELGNRGVLKMLKTDPNAGKRLADELGMGVEELVKYMESGASGALRPLNPPLTEWHHPTEAADVVELLLRTVHRDPVLQSILHPLLHRGGGRLLHGFE